MLIVQFIDTLTYETNKSLIVLFLFLSNVNPPRPAISQISTFVELTYVEMREMNLNEEERCVIITKEYQQPYLDARHHTTAGAAATPSQTPCGRRRYYAVLASL